MTSELSDHEKKVIMAYEISEEEAPTTSFSHKRAQGDNGSNPSASPRKRQKGFVGDQEVHALLPHEDKLNAHGKASAEEDGNVGRNGTEIESGTSEESLEGRDGRDNAVKTTGSPTPEQGNIVLARHWLQMLHDSPPAADATGSGEEKLDSPPAADATASGEEELKINREPPGSEAKLSGQADQDSYPSSFSDDSSNEEESLVPKSVIQRQQNDPELREKIHQVETDWELGRTTRNVYNEERFKFYTKEELKKAHIVWPHREVHSPAGYREREMEYGNYRTFEAGESWDDTLFEFGCPFEEQNTPAGDEDDAKKRLMDKIEEKFKDLEAKMAEHKRWEEIREVETKYYNDEISREEYNKLRFMLYTEEEREEKGVVWPHDYESEEECRSPAGYRSGVFSSRCLDRQTRMAFHCPFYDSKYEKKSGEETLCELCIPLIEEDRVLKIKQDEEREARRKAEEKKEEERLLQRQKQEEERLLAIKNGLFRCAACKRNFGTDNALSQHKKQDEEREARRKAEEKKEEERLLQRQEKEGERLLVMKKGLFRCAVCKKNFRTDSALSQHTAVKHQK